MPRPTAELPALDAAVGDDRRSLCSHGAAGEALGLLRQDSSVNLKTVLYHIMHLNDNQT